MANRFLAPYGRGLRNHDPLLDLHREMNRLFDDMFGFGGSSGAGGGLSTLASSPRLDMHESENELTIEAELPGVERNDIDVRLDGDMLTLCGEKRSQRDDRQQNAHFSERSYGRFQRTVQLPFRPEPDDIEAEFDAGVLRLRLQKRPETASGSRRIEVREGRRSLQDGSSASGGASGQAMTSAMSGGGGASQAGRATTDASPEKSSESTAGTKTNRT
jgi:HSP20 family protein